MTQQNNAFEKWFESELQKLIDVKNYDDMRMLQINEHLAWKAWQAATQQSEREISELKEALHEINTLRGTTLNFGVARAIACRALGIKHTDSSEPPSTESLKTPIDEMVNKFLGWKLPSDFSPDCGIIFDGNNSDKQGFNPTGTNLFTATQAKAMFEYVALEQITELQASNNKLREALEDCTLHPSTFHIARKALASTPAQSLAEHDNEVLERAAKVCDRYHYIPDAAPYDCAKAIREMKGIS